MRIRKSNLLAADSRYSVVLMPWWLRWLRRYKLCMYNDGTGMVYGDTVNELFIKFERVLEQTRDLSLTEMETMPKQLADALAGTREAYVELQYVSIELERYGRSILKLRLKYRPVTLYVDVDYDDNDTELVKAVDTVMSKGGNILYGKVQDEIARVRKVCNLACEIEKTRNTGNE